MPFSSIILFVLYGLLLSWLVYYLPFFKRSGLKPSFLLGLFWLRVAAGMVHLVVAWRFYPNHGDIWAFFEEGRFMKYNLLHDMPHLLRDLQVLPDASGVLASGSAWSLFQYKLMHVVHGLFCFLSLDNHFVSTLLFAFPVFMASVLLYRLLLRHFDAFVPAALAALVIPSVVFWTACIHKEGILLCLLGFLLWQWQHLLDRIRWQPVAACVLLLAGIFLFRNSLLLVLVPALVLWSSAALFPRFLKWVVVAGVVLLAAACLQGGLLSQLADRQAEASALEGGSRLYFPTLSPSIGSFLQALPFALLNGFLQPLPGAGGKAIYAVFGMEVLLVWSFVLLGLAGFVRRRPVRVPAFVWFCLVFGLAGQLLTGYTMPFAGTIIRYRSLFTLFFLPPFLWLACGLPFFASFGARMARLMGR